MADAAVKKTGIPEVNQAREFLEIVRDFTDPKETIREAISNAVDWHANEIEIKVKEDKSRPEEELVITIRDNGDGLDEQRLKAFFDLGQTIKPMQQGTADLNPIGEKGHGTKTYFNSRKIEVESNSKQFYVYAEMNEPIASLMKGTKPPYEYQAEAKENKETYTNITIYGYNMNKNKKDFDHKVLKDYILWFTKFGAVEKEFGHFQNADKVLKLQGLGEAEPENIRYGHLFPKENCDLKKLKERKPGDWPKSFVKRWVFQKEPVIECPGRSIDIVFYVEGDEAKRNYNPMIRRQRKEVEYGMYKVEERYGLWACKDHIPIRRCNEWLGLGKRLETKYHAFVNCQDFRLTANRGDIGNTPPDLLQAIEATVRRIFEDKIIGSQEYQEYKDYEVLEQQYQTEAEEGKDFARRKKRARQKKVCKFKGIEVVEPSMEMGVVCVFNQIYALKPSLFPFQVVDYDTRRGYDALVEHQSTRDLSKPLSFIEFKHSLGGEFNHSFEHLFAIICWDCHVSNGEKVRDIGNHELELKITPKRGKGEYTRYMLCSSTTHNNIEVFVLKQYLQEKLHLGFKPKTSV